jgi:DNA polymerase-3 subunit gamma/tau
VIDPRFEYLATRAQQDRLRDALKPALGASLRLQVDPGKPAGETAADKAARAQMERQAEAENAIGGDPFVREMQKVFDATVDPDSIRPVD